MKGQWPGGPEQGTLVERFVGTSHLPYTAGCLLYGVVIFGILNSLISYAAIPLPLNEALGRTFTAEGIATFFLGAYLLYVPKYMRSKVLAAEQSFSSLLENGEAEFHELFGRVSALKPQLLAWACGTAGLIVTLVILPGLFGSSSLTAPSSNSAGTILTDLVGLTSAIASLAFFGLGLAALAWSYYSVLKGISLSGSRPLKMSPYYSDPFLGLRPLGSMALSLASAYFGALWLLVLIFALGPTPSTGDLVGGMGLLAGLTVLGVVMFFLPLRKLHHQMVAHKRHEKLKLAGRLHPVFQEQNEYQDEKKTQSQMLETLKLDLIDRKISGVASWPFDFSVIGKLTVIVLSVSAALITRILALLLSL